MAQPDDYGFSEEASLLKNSARKFFKNNFSTDKLHRMVADNSDYSGASESPWDKEPLAATSRIRLDLARNSRVSRGTRLASSRCCGLGGRGRKSRLSLPVAGNAECDLCACRLR